MVKSCKGNKMFGFLAVSTTTDNILSPHRFSLSSLWFAAIHLYYFRQGCLNEQLLFLLQNQLLKKSKDAFCQIHLLEQNLPKISALVFIFQITGCCRIANFCQLYQTCIIFYKLATSYKYITPINHKTLHFLFAKYAVLPEATHESSISTQPMMKLRVALFLGKIFLFFISSTQFSIIYINQMQQFSPRRLRSSNKIKRSHKKSRKPYLQCHCRSAIDVNLQEHQKDQPIPNRHQANNMSIMQKMHAEQEEFAGAEDINSQKVENVVNLRGRLTNLIYPFQKYKQFDMIRFLNLETFPVVIISKNLLLNRKQYECSFCNRTVNSRRKLRLHQNNSHFLQYRFLNQFVIEQQIQPNHDPSMVNEQSNQRNYHLIYFNPNFGEETYRYFKCRFCSYVDYRPNLVRNHVAKLCKGSALSHQDTEIKPKEEHINVVNQVAPQPIVQNNQNQLQYRPTRQNMRQFGLQQMLVQVPQAVIKQQQIIIFNKTKKQNRTIIDLIGNQCQQQNIVNQIYIKEELNEIDNTSKMNESRQQQNKPLNTTLAVDQTTSPAKLQQNKANQMMDGLPAIDGSVILASNKIRTARIVEQQCVQTQLINPSKARTPKPCQSSKSTCVII